MSGPVPPIVRRALARVGYHWHNFALDQLWWADALMRLRPAPDAPLCPDCRIGPDVGDNCPFCEDHAEAQRRDAEIYAAGAAELEAEWREAYERGELR